MTQKKTKLTPEEKAAKAAKAKEIAAKAVAGANKEKARKAAKDKLAQDNDRAKNKLNKEIAELIRNEAETIIPIVFKREIEKAAESKIANLMMQIPDIQNGVRIHDKVYCRFSSEQLLAIFGDWFTLKYAFTTKYQNSDGTESETDYYVCSQDVSGKRVNERPPLNMPLYKAFGIEVYGFAIIAPSTAFG